MSFFPTRCHESVSAGFSYLLLSMYNFSKSFNLVTYFTSSVMEVSDKCILKNRQIQRKASHGIITIVKMLYATKTSIFKVLQLSNSKPFFLLSMHHCCILYLLPKINMHVQGNTICVRNIRGMKNSESLKTCFRNV